MVNPPPAAKGEIRQSAAETVANTRTKREQPPPSNVSEGQQGPTAAKAEPLAGNSAALG